MGEGFHSAVMMIVWHKLNINNNLGILNLQILNDPFHVRLLVDLSHFWIGQLYCLYNCVFQIVFYTYLLPIIYKKITGFIYLAAQSYGAQ